MAFEILELLLQPAIHGLRYYLKHSAGCYWIRSKWPDTFNCLLQDDTNRFLLSLNCTRPHIKCPLNHFRLAEHNMILSFSRLGNITITGCLTLTNSSIKKVNLRPKSKKGSKKEASFYHLSLLPRNRYFIIQSKIADHYCSNFLHPNNHHSDACSSFLSFTMLLFPFPLRKTEPCIEGHTCKLLS